MTLVEGLRAVWRALAPHSGQVEPVLVALDEWRTQLAWCVAPLVFDRRRQVVLRQGRAIARLADIRTVDVQHVSGDDDGPEHWRVSLGTGVFSDVEIGATRVDVEASIAAARIATLLDVPVRAL